MAFGSSCRARIGRGRSQAASPVAKSQQAMVQTVVLHTCLVSDLLPRGAAGIVHLSGGAAASDRVGAQGFDRGAPDGARAAVVLLRFLHSASHEHHPGVFLLPDCLHPESLWT